MREILMFSGGECSFSTGVRLLKLGREPELLFTDTLIEDADLYRFLVEGAAYLRGVPKSRLSGVRRLAASVPPLGDPGRARHLCVLASAAMAAVPGFYWLADGRTPFEVFRDKRFLGNTRLASCSHLLKQDVARAWLERHCDPADTVVHLGIHWQESERFAGTKNSKGAREHWLPWRAEAVLCDPPHASPAEMAKDVERAGITRSRLYGLGLPHNNCSGACVKAGQKHFLKVLRELPATYAYFEAGEEAVRAHLGKDVAILRDRSGGKTTPMTLREFRLRQAKGVDCDAEDANAGCGCFSAVYEEKEET